MSMTLIIILNMIMIIILMIKLVIARVFPRDGLHVVVEGLTWTL